MAFTHFVKYKGARTLKNINVNKIMTIPTQEEMNNLTKLTHLRMIDYLSL